jgi:hypothetical protein
VWTDFDAELIKAARAVRPGQSGPVLAADAGFADLRDVERVLRVHGRAIKALVAASRNPSQSLEDSERMRDAARVLHADAWRLWNAGDAAGASERLGAMYSICLQSHSRETLLALTRSGVLGLANRSVRAMCGAPTPLPGPRACELLRLLRMLDAHDPAEVARAKGDYSLDADRRERARADMAEDLGATIEALRGGCG